MTETGKELISLYQLCYDLSVSSPQKIIVAFVFCCFVVFVYVFFWRGGGGGGGGGQKIHFRNMIRVSNSLDPGQPRHNVWPDLGTNCLHRLSADGTSRQELILILK